MEANHETLLNRVNTCSSPSDLKITDIRFVDLYQTPMHCILVKIYTNQGITGIGEVRDFGSRTYASMLKGRILGENPCNVNKIFSSLKQFGGPARQGGGVSGIEIALMDLVGKAYGVPVYQLLGGKFRDNARVYCDLGRHPESRNDGYGMGKDLKKFVDRDGFTMVKAVLGVEQLQSLYPDEVIYSAPTGFKQDFIKAQNIHMRYCDANFSADPNADFLERNWAMRLFDREGSYSFERITEHGLDRFEEEVAHMREVLGDEIPLAIDHPGHVGLEDAVKILKRLEKYNLSWVEDILPAYYIEEYKRLSALTTTPLATGEDLYLREGFEPLCKERAVAMIHPDICSCGGIQEAHLIGGLAQKHNMALIMHMCETPVSAMATAHVGVATENFVAMEFNSPDDPWWNDLVIGMDNPIIKNGFITPTEKPGLGFDNLNDEVLQEHLLPNSPPLWASTEIWDSEYSNDRLWS